MGLRNFIIAVLVLLVVLVFLLSRKEVNQRGTPDQVKESQPMPIQKDTGLEPSVANDQKDVKQSNDQIKARKIFAAQEELQKLLKQFVDNFKGSNSEDPLILSLVNKILDLIKEDTEDILISALKNATATEVKKQLIWMVVEYDFIKHSGQKLTDDIMYGVEYDYPLPDKLRELLSEIVLNKKEDSSVRARALEQFIFTFDKKILAFIVNVLTVEQDNELRSAALGLTNDYLERCRDQLDGHFPQFEGLDLLSKTHLLNAAEVLFRHEIDEDLRFESARVLGNDYLRNRILLDTFDVESSVRVRNAIRYSLCDQLKYACNDFERRLIDRQTLLNVARNIVPFIFEELSSRERENKTSVLSIIGHEALSGLQEFRSQILEKLIDIASANRLEDNREMAIRSLGEGGYVEALDFLKKLAETEKNAEIKDACQDAIERLTQGR